MTEAPRICDWQRAVMSPSGPTRPNGSPDPTQRVVACALALFMDQGGRNCFPSQTALADAAGVAERTLRTALQALEDSGWIERFEVGDALKAGYVDESRIGDPGQRWRLTCYRPSMPSRTPERAATAAAPSRLGVEGPATAAVPSTVENPQRAATAAAPSSGKVRQLTQEGAATAAGNLYIEPNQEFIPSSQSPPPTASEREEWEEVEDQQELRASWERVRPIVLSEWHRGREVIRVAGQRVGMGLEHRHWRQLLEIYGDPDMVEGVIRHAPRTWETSAPHSLAWLTSDDHGPANLARAEAIWRSAQPQIDDSVVGEMLGGLMGREMSR